MIHPELHRNPVALDRQQDRGLRLRRDADDNARFATLNSMFVVAGEVGEACKDYPVVWIEAGTDANGARQVAPIAVFGLGKGQNLCLEGGAWRTAYLPVMMRMYPFALARSGDVQYAICRDGNSARLSFDDGEPLFEADGTPTALTLDIQQQLEQVEMEVERTRQMGLELLRLDLLREMRFQATLPDGGSVGADGFLTVDEKRFAELPDAELPKMHKSGLLRLVHAHQLSLSNMRRLAQWHGQRNGAAPAANT
ncbi:MAG TPA: SapC family protein [Burkholderiaceae bacterium]|nr:SapC family protein [Burkholderiaceae bacterium]